MTNGRDLPIWLLGLVVSSALAVPVDAQSQTSTGGSGTSSTEVAVTPAAKETEAESAAEEVVPDEPTYTEDELDDLVAPVALYPDSLLAQVLVAATYPMDVIKADRWVKEHADIEASAREDATSVEDWDPSVAILAAGFPTVISRMSEDIDWTEDLGDAVILQSDDVLDAVQRQRARAAAVGNLESNEAQQVVVEDDNISIEPANPEVIYVPSYDSQAVYTTAPSAAPVVINATEPGFSTGALITTGLLSFGAGMLVSEIFDDDDDDWHGYWGPDYYHRHVDWDDGYFRPGPGCRNCDIDIDIDIDEVNIDRDRWDNDGRWRPNRERRDKARDKMRDSKRDRDGIRNRDRAPDRESIRDRSRDDLRKTIAARSEGGRDLKRKPDGDRNKTAKRTDRKGSAFSGNQDRGNNRASVTSAKKAKARGERSREKAGIKSRNGGGRDDAAKTKRNNAKAFEKPRNNQNAKRKSSGKGSAMSKRGGGKKAGKASSRGKKSRSGGRKQR